MSPLRGAGGKPTRLWRGQTVSQPLLALLDTTWWFCGGEGGIIALGRQGKPWVAEGEFLLLMPLL